MGTRTVAAFGFGGLALLLGVVGLAFGLYLTYQTPCHPADEAETPAPDGDQSAPGTPDGTGSSTDPVHEKCAGPGTALFYGGAFVALVGGFLVFYGWVQYVYA